MAKLNISEWVNLDMSLINSIMNIKVSEVSEVVSEVSEVVSEVVSNELTNKSRLQMVSSVMGTHEGRVSSDETINITTNSTNSFTTTQEKTQP